MDESLAGANGQWLRQRIAASLDDCQVIADRFTQCLTAPYGQIWQTSLLVDASPRRVAVLASKLDKEFVSLQRHGRRTLLSMLGVLALVCLVYAFLNAVTRGYFVWSLRAMALAVLAGGIFLVLLLRG